MRLRDRPKLFWNRLWIRKDEFHPSLDIDPIASSYMTKEERELYYKDIVRRREIAHRLDNINR